MSGRYMQPMPVCLCCCLIRALTSVLPVLHTLVPLEAVPCVITLSTPFWVTITMSDSDEAFVTHLRDQSWSLYGVGIFIILLRL